MSIFLVFTKLILIRVNDLMKLNVTIFTAQMKFLVGSLYEFQEVSLYVVNALFSASAYSNVVSPGEGFADKTSSEKKVEGNSTVQDVIF